jgi:hypothetical protein
MKAVGIALLVLTSIIGVLYGGGALIHVYENEVLLKDSIHDLDVANAAEAQEGAELNYQYELSVADRLEAEGKLKAAEAAYKKAYDDKPLHLTQIVSNESTEAEKTRYDFIVVLLDLIPLVGSLILIAASRKPASPKASVWESITGENL